MNMIINFLKRLFKGHGKLPYTYVCKDCQETVISLKAFRSLNVVSIRKEATDKTIVTRSFYGFGYGDVKPAIGIYYLSGKNEVEAFPIIMYANTVKGEVVETSGVVSKETAELRTNLRNSDYENLCRLLGIPMNTRNFDTFVSADSCYFDGDVGVDIPGHFFHSKNKTKSTYREAIKELDSITQKGLTQKGTSGIKTVYPTKLNPTDRIDAEDLSTVRLDE